MVRLVFPAAAKSNFQGVARPRPVLSLSSSAGGPGEPARREGHFCYWLGPLLAASACSIFFAISAFTASRLKLAPLCIGG